ncbi:MAG: hypothetical protein GY828_05470 [Candidatus Gracilibacteria bacterium]|nr:hypothetical protein [Candidatus Gracilibacteria bacterium]
MKKIKYILLLIIFFVGGSLFPYKINGFLWLRICNTTDTNIHYLNIPDKINFSFTASGECSSYKYVGNMEELFEIQIHTKEGNMLYGYNITPFDREGSKQKYFGKKTIYIQNIYKTQSIRTHYLQAIKSKFDD